MCKQLRASRGQIRRSGEKDPERESGSEVMKNLICFTMSNNLYHVRLRAKLTLNFYILSLPLFATRIWSNSKIYAYFKLKDET